MEYIEITDSQSIFYEEFGQGSLIVLLPGSLTTSKFWRNVGQHLSSRFRIIIPNLPGFGGSDPRPTDIQPTTGYVASCFEKLLNYLGKPAVLCGHSYGGSVALDMAIRKQIPTLGLALFEPVASDILISIGKRDTYEKLRNVFENYQEKFKNGDVEAVGQVIDYWFGTGVFDNMPEPIQTFLIDHTAANILDVQASFSQKIPLEDLQAITIPVLAVGGSESHNTSVEIVETIASHVPNGQFIKIDGADHGMINTHPDTIVELISEFANLCL